MMSTTTAHGNRTKEEGGLTPSLLVGKLCQNSELVSVADLHTTTSSIDTPTDSPVRLVGDVFKIDGDLGALAEADSAPYTY